MKLLLLSSLFSTLTLGFAPSRTTTTLTRPVPTLGHSPQSGSALFVSLNTGPEEPSLPSKANKGSKSSSAESSSSSLKEQMAVNAILVVGLGGLFYVGGTTVTGAFGDLASAAGGALGEEIVHEIIKVLSLIGSLLQMAGGLAWEATKVLVPALGRVAVAGYGMAAPVVEQAARDAAPVVEQAVREAAPVVEQAVRDVVASPMVQEATSQISQATTPVVDSVNAAIDASIDSVGNVMDATMGTVGTAVDQASGSVKGAVDSVLGQSP